MIKVLFVCHGNICRSPMAEFILKKIIKENKTEHMFEVASAATSTEEIYNGKGNPVYPPAKAELGKHGIEGTDVNSKRARRVTKEDYTYYDYLICMDSNNVRNTLHIVGDDRDCKITKLLSYCNEDGDVADPWYSDRFDEAYNDIRRGCEAFYIYCLKNVKKV